MRFFRSPCSAVWLTFHVLLAAGLFKLVSISISIWVACALCSRAHMGAVQSKLIFPRPVWAWFFLLIIAFRYVPNSIVTRPVEAIWIPLVQKPFLALPRWTRLTMGWLALLAIVFGSAFGFALQGVIQFR